jgi:hypothetical protein
MKDWRLDALPDLVTYLLAAALLGLFVGLAIFGFRAASTSRISSRVDSVRVVLWANPCTAYYLHLRRE